MKWTTDHLTFQLVCTVTGLLPLALLMREDSAAGRDSTIRSYLHYLVILYLPGFSTSTCDVVLNLKQLSEPNMKTLSWAALVSFYQLLVPGVHWRMYSHKAVMSLLTPAHKPLDISYQYTAYLCWLTLCIIGLNGRHKTLASSIPTCLQSPNFNSSLNFKQQSSGPSEIQKSSYK